MRGFSPAVPGAAGGDFQARLATGTSLAAYVNATGLDVITAADAQTGLPGNASNAVIYAMPAVNGLLH